MAIESGAPATVIPSRFDNPSWLSGVLFVLFIGFFSWALYGSEFSLSNLVEGIPNMGVIMSEMVPPDTERAWPIAKSVFVTLQMALVGAVIGIVLSLPLAFLAARNTSPHPLVYKVVRAWVSLVRTIPDLAWALFFVASVGLGPFAGVLTLIVDTIGFCARFFAEAIEEADPQPNEALKAIGAGTVDRCVVAILPEAAPSIINSSLFSLEKAVRSSVVLGLVGAGGIGAELAVSMEMFRYDQAATIILMVFVLVYGVERLSGWAREKCL
ncbi:MAG: phosphonate ABC transporter, permease protein PhnE [Oceanospirillaceae bacterium]|jgi:phosphonate transport system permease protein|uniref:phosphonate ABC transporter, permease protein PhnE n=1 Tax=Marinobacterium litorale TaxID=404770 RepID=UPI00040E1D58|nr:phosphonate ABC transporter, permease protein PhnE [Marinobacterium litorale]MBT00838.1 phosphonate ABC transporter, permease protein PhnE [Oceanospirillaceae bacterium]